MRIFVHNLEFTGRHGVYEEERREGRRFQVDLVVDLAKSSSTDTDELGDTLDYRDLADVIVELGHGPSCILVERLAGQILSTIFERHDVVQSATVQIRKFATGVPGEPEWVGVELTRNRSNL